MHSFEGATACDFELQLSWAVLTAEEASDEFKRVQRHGVPLIGCLNRRTATTRCGSCTVVVVLRGGVVITHQEDFVGEGSGEPRSIPAG